MPFLTIYVVDQIVSQGSGIERFSMTPMEAAICGVVDSMEMFRLTIMDSFKPEDLGTNPFMMSFYIEE